MSKHALSANIAHKVRGNKAHIRIRLTLLYIFVNYTATLKLPGRGGIGEHILPPRVPTQLNLQKISVNQQRLKSNMECLPCPLHILSIFSEISLIARFNLSFSSRSLANCSS